MIETLKKIANQAADNRVPCAVMYGKVTKTLPLELLVDNRFTVPEEAIILMRQFKAGSYETHTHTVPEVGTTTGETYAGLAVGDKVALLRNYGGQQFLILGRV